MSFEQQLEKYAKLVVQVGINVQKNQPVHIIGTVEMAPLIRKLVKEAYAVGASYVYVDWGDDEVMRLRYEHASDEMSSYFPTWEKEKREDFMNKQACVISITSSTPDLLKGIDSARISAFQKAAGSALYEYRKAMQADKFSWTVIAGAGQAWAEKVFPNETPEAAVAKLWEAIFKAVRLDAADPAKAWEEHHDTLYSKAEALNAYKFKKLHYTAPGTDLTVELNDKHLWVAAGSENAQGFSFMANMPTEEVFTVPDRDGTNGYVSSTKPLSYGGNVIDNFKITFENGRAVKYEAKQGEDILGRLLDTDEGAKYLGEVALVPHKSPISESGILFFNTLFDENASNHLALGSGYAFNIDGGKTMDAEALKAHGVNASITHNDFMIGSELMNIDGIQADGTVIPVFRNGAWAF